MIPAPTITTSARSRMARRYHRRAVLDPRSAIPDPSYHPPPGQVARSWSLAERDAFYAAGWIARRTDDGFPPHPDPLARAGEGALSPHRNREQDARSLASPLHLRRSSPAHLAARQRADAAPRAPRRSRRLALVEPPAPPRALLRRPLLGRGAAHP